MVMCLAQWHKRRDRPGRDSNPHSELESNALDRSATTLHIGSRLSWIGRVLVHSLHLCSPGHLEQWHFLNFGAYIQPWNEFIRPWFRNGNCQSFPALSARRFIFVSLFELDVNTCTSRKVGAARVVNNRRTTVSTIVEMDNTWRMAF